MTAAVTAAADRAFRALGRAARSATAALALYASALGCGEADDPLPSPTPVGVVVAQHVATSPGRTRVRLVVREVDDRELTITHGVEALACDGGSRYPECLVP